MNIAVCFSGQLRSLDLTYKNISKFLNENFENYKIFAHIPENKNINQEFTDYFSNSIYAIEKDPKIKKTKLKNMQFKSVRYKFKNSLTKAKIAHMQQLYGIFKSNQLKTIFEKENNILFDWVLRCKSDIKFYNSHLDLSNMNSQYLYTPNFHNWGGINDRFVMSSSENMDVFANLFNYVLENAVEGFNAESIFKNYLVSKNIELKELNCLKFNRIRLDGSELQDF